MSAQPLSAACSCGQVVFDITSKRPGHVLTCPWCRKMYTVAEGHRIEEVKAEEPPPLPPGGEPLPHRSLAIHKRRVTTIILRKPKDPASAAPETGKTGNRTSESSIGLKRLKPSAITSSKAELLKQAAKRAADSVPAQRDRKLETRRVKTEMKRAKTETKSARPGAQGAKTETKRGATGSKSGRPGSGGK